MSAVVPHTFENVALDTVSSHPGNPRRGDIDAIVESIVANGFFGVLVVQRSTRHILVGNHRAIAARIAGLREIPAMIVDCDDRTAERILLADNRIAENATWDEEALILLLQSLSADDSLRGSGFAESDLADLLVAFEPEGETGKLDRQKATICPQCGFKFVPQTHIEDVE